MKLTRRGRLNETMTRRGKMCRQRLLDESGLLTTERDICFANIVLEMIFIFSHYFKCSILIEIMVIYPLFIRLFYFTHKVSFHFHLYNYYMYKFWLFCTHLLLLLQLSVLLLSMVNQIKMRDYMDRRVTSP